MRLILSRAAAARTLLVAATLATTVTAVLLTGFLLYAQLLPVAAVRAAVADAQPVERTLLVRSGAGGEASEVTARDQAVRGLLGGELAGDRAPVFAAGYASGQQLPPGLAPEEGDPVVGFLTGLPEHAELVAGEWAQPVPEPEPGQATLPASVAATLGLAVGDEVAMVDSRSADDLPAPLRVVGLWAPIDPADPYWRLLSAPLALGGWGPFVLHPDEFVARYQLLASLEWLAVPDPGRLAEAGTDPVAADVERLHAELAELQADPALGGSLRLSTRLDDLTERLAIAIVVTRSGMVLPAALLVVIAGFGLVLVARLLTAHRRGENALLRARGASRRQLVRFTATEAVLVVLPAAALGGPVGTALVRYVDQRAGDRSLSVTGDLAGYGLLGPPLAWAVAIAAAVGCALALALPAAGRGRTWVAEQQERSRPTRAAALQRAGVDLALVVLAVLAWTQLRQYGSAVAPTDAGGLGIDPLLVAAPVVGVLAATAVALRLLPLATRLGVRLAGRRDAFPGLLGMWQADRRPHAGPVLLLVLAVAIAVLAPAVATTWQESQRDQAAHQVGADLRIPVNDASASSGRELAAALPGATGLMPVHRTDIQIAEAETSTLLAIGSEPAPAVARLRPDLASTRLAELFGGLREGRPELTGMPLPEGAERLVGRFTFTVPEPRTYRFLRSEFNTFPPEQTPVRVELPRPSPERMAAHIRDASGLIRSVEFGRRTTGASGVPTGGIELDEAGGLDFDLALPPDATELVGLSAGLVAPGWDPRFFLDEETASVPVRWNWPQLRTVGADGAEDPLEPPDDWQVLQRRGDDSQGPQPQRRDGLTVTTTLDPARDYPTSLQFVLAAPPPTLTNIPLVVSPDLLAASGAQVGDAISVTGGAGGISSAKIVGVVDAVPGTETGSGVLLDLTWLSTHQFLWGRQAPAVSEWWAAAPPSTNPESLAGLDWVGAVQDRRAEAEQRLSDPLGSGVLVTLWAAAAAAALLAAFGLVVDARATAVRRRRELAVLHTLGTSPAGLARALVVEQAVLAGLGVAAGVLVGVAVAAGMGTSLVLTAAGAVPVPEPLLALSPTQFAAPTAGLFAVAVVLGAAVARRARREVAAGALRIGED